MYLDRPQLARQGVALRRIVFVSQRRQRTKANHLAFGEPTADVKQIRAEVARHSFTVLQ
jgi:hypothetical protein